MKRFVLVLPVLVVAALAGAAPSVADPAEPGCTVTLTAPEVTDQSGTPMVTATARPAACNRAEPMMQVACLQMQGSPTPPKCMSKDGPNTARVYLAPYQPGATYVATGRSCANAGNPPTTYCRTAGPITAML